MFASTKLDDISHFLY